MHAGKYQRVMEISLLSLVGWFVGWSVGWLVS